MNIRMKSRWLFHTQREREREREREKARWLPLAMINIHARLNLHDVRTEETINEYFSHDK